MSTLMFKKLFFIILVIIFVAHLIFRINSYSGRYTTKYDPAYWKNRYLQSQWVDPESKNPIGDDGLYTYAAWEYIQGHDPTLLNPEMPFLGKYLLGLTIVTFHNENIFALIIGICVLVALLIFNRMLFTSVFWAFIPVFLFSLEPLFYEQLRAPFFDLLHLLFLLLVFITFIKQKYWLSSLFLGLFASSKFPFMVILPGATVVITLYLTAKKKAIFRYLLTVPIGLFVYVLTYFRFFLLGNSFYEFLRVQKYILNFYAIGAKIPFIGTIFPMIFSGTWFTHFQTKLHVAEWNFGWPLSILLSIFSFRYFHKKDTGIILIAVWVFVYLLFLSITPLFPRYLLLLLPFLYNLSIWGILKSLPARLSRQPS